MPTYYIDLADFTLPTDGNETAVSGFVRRDDSGVPDSWQRDAGTRQVFVSDTPVQLTIPALVAGSIAQGSPEIGDTLTVTGSNETGTGTYQWEESADGSAGWADISGATSASLDTSSGVTDDYFVRRGVTDGAQSEVFTAAVQVSAVTAVDVGAAATFSTAEQHRLTAPFNGTNPTAITYWGIFIETAGGSNRDIMEFTNSFNLVQFRKTGIRLNVDDGSTVENVTDLIGGTYTVGDQIAFIASLDAATSTATIGLHRGGAGWRTRTATLSSVANLAISGEDFVFNLDSVFSGAMIRYGVAIGVALDGTSGTVQDALIQNGTDTPVVNAATLQALMSGGKVGVDMYGGTARFNAGTNDGAWGDMTITGAWT